MTKAPNLSSVALAAIASAAREHARRVYLRSTWQMSPAGIALLADESEFIEHDGPRTLAAKATTLSNATVQAQGDALARLLDNGYLKIYSGSQPANADAAITGTLLATLRFSATSAPATSTAGLITFNAITSDSDAAATNTATHFRCFKSDNSTPVMDGTVDITGNTPNLVLSTVSIVQHATVAVSSFTHQINKTTATL